MSTEPSKPAKERIDPEESKRILSVLNTLSAAADKAEAASQDEACNAGS